ncbi:uncharacterized protein tasor2 isoform X2 [Sphaeramia orbicularis]|uniref:uncharacterized protein tasor2 isoform X2 n=1 Tax=Sphaeramia orbicularis TaxID=375764 RepID=UPI001180A684|nr:uncharacterized protein LOC115421242 isoform X2 [Sphaeramia orbicularis]
MERESDVSSSTGVLRPVSENTDDFKNNILAPLQSAYLFEESKQSFRYKSGFLIKNPALEEKYNAYRAKRKDLGYSEEELKETYGFLLFDELSKAKAVGEGGVLTRNGTCSTLGDPSKGIYLSMYSDCLDLNSWYHGKSGYIAIIRLTQGRVKKVLENYTQNFTTPTVGFDCHVSEQLPTVSSKTSSFLAFERTQYYMYELLDSGSDKTAEAPSLVCPFAVVAFSYTDTKATTETTEEKSAVKNVAFPYLAWTGQLQLGTQFHSVGLRSTAGSLVRAKLPPVVKVERAISMLDLRQLLPRAAFETSFSGEAFLDGLYCSLCELTVSVVEENSSFSQLLQEIKYKDLAFTVPLDDAGFLILLHSSHFCMYENDTGSNSKDVLQGMFVFPDSQVTQRDIKFEQKRLAIPSDIQRALPLLTYAEGEAEKTLLNPSKERNKIIVQHMQSYAALINPVLALSPLREVSIFVDQYDVPDAHKHLYASPEWTDLSWQSFRSYLSKPVSFQVPVLTATEILAAGQEDRREELDDDVYICLSSPEEAPADFVSKASEEQVDQRFSPDTETSPAEAKSPAADAKTFLAEVETSLAVFKTSLAEVETSLAEVQTSLAEVETSLAEVETSLPEVETSLPEVETSLPEVEPSLADVETSLTDVETSLPEVESSLGDVETSIADAEASIADAETSIADAETSPADAGASLESHTTNMEKRLVVTAVPQNTVPDDFQDGEGKTSSTETEKSGLRNVLIPPISDDLPAELIVSITSAAQTVSEEDLTVISTASATKLNDSQLSVSSMEKLQMVGLNSLNDEVVKTKQTLECTEAKNPTKPHWGKQCKGHRLLSPSKVVPVKHDTGNVRRAKRKFGNLLSRREAGEEKQQDSPKDMLEDTVLHELEAYSLRKKTERWDLKPVISECGKILVPHGTLEFTDKIESLKGKLWSSAVEQCPEKMLVDAPVHTGTMGEMEHESNDVSETPQGKATVQEHLLETLSSMKCASKEETMLTKLKSVLFRSKRKGDHVSQKPNAETASDSEVSPKKIRSDLDDEMLKSNNAITCVQETNVCVQEVSKMLSVDLVFAQALGLTPKETPDKLQKAVGHKVQQRKDSPETEEQSIAHKQPQIILRPPSIFPRRSRIKMLKKHQSVPAEHIRSKWWLHFQTPACFDTEKLKYKECGRDISVRKTVKERMRAACSPTDALNLLADLALSANKDQVPPQPAQALATKPESSLKNCDLTKGVTSPETESFLHALLRQPAARPIQPLEPPSPSPVLGGSELVDVVSIEHAYSLPPSSSLLLGLPGTPFQVSPLSGSTRLLLHPQQKYSDGTQTLQPSVYLEEKVELNQRTPGWLKKCTRRRKFRHSRTFVNKDRTVQVTRQWEENYDFNLDSRFTIDSLDKAVNRALHGPWDLSMYDTTEEVRLIIHMWIGLFYSRSTARFFHLDPNFTFSPSEDSNGLEMSSGKMSDALHSEPVSNDPVPSATDTSPSQALDLSKNSNSVLDQGSVLLDLSLRTTDADVATLDPKVSNKHLLETDEQKGLCETQNALIPSLGLHVASPFQCYRNMVHSKGIVRKVNDSRSIHAKQRTCVPSQKDDCLEHTDKPSSENDRISVGGGKENVSIQLPSVPPALEINNMSHGSCNERTGFKDGMEHSDNTTMCLVHKPELDLKKVVTCDEVKSNTDPRIELHSVVHYKNVSKNGENFEVKDDSHATGATVEDSSTVVCTDDNSTDKKPDAVCNEHVFEKETRHLKVHSPCQSENAVEDKDCTEHESKVIGDGNSFEKEDKSKKDVETGSDLSDQPLSIVCDGPDSVKDDCIPELDCQAPVTEEQLQAGSRRGAVKDLPFKRLCANDNVLPDKCAVSENAFINKEDVNRETATETCSENICLSDKATYKNSTACLDVSKAGEPSIQMDNLEPVIQAELMTNLNMHNEGDIKSVMEQQKVDNTTQEPVDHQAPVFQDEVIKNMETELGMTDELYVKYDEERKGLWNTHGRVIIPFIGVDTSFEEIMESRFSDPKWEVQGKEAIPFISTTTGTEEILLTEVNSETHVNSEHAELFCGKMPFNASDTKEQVVCKESGSDDRCPTPTIDERPYRYAFSGPTAALNSVIHRDITLKDHSRSSTPVMDETALEHKSILSDSFCDGVKSDLELRTLRVLQSVGEFFTLPHTNESSQTQTAENNTHPQTTFQH